MMDAVLADRSQQSLGEAAMPPAAHDQQVSTVSLVDEDLRRIALPDHLRDPGMITIASRPGNGLSQELAGLSRKVAVLQHPERRPGVSAQEQRIVPRASSCVSAPANAAGR